VPNLDDERFEIYLKRFRPAMPDPLLVGESRPAPRRPFVFATWAVGAVAIVILGVASLRIFNHPIAVDSSRSGSVQGLGSTPPLTMRDANALLRKAPSYKALMNELALHPKSSTFSKNRQSAFAVLGKEKTKL
jgi:hypothetical protein